MTMHQWILGMPPFQTNPHTHTHHPHTHTHMDEDEDDDEDDDDDIHFLHDHLNGRLGCSSCRFNGRPAAAASSGARPEAKRGASCCSQSQNSPDKSNRFANFSEIQRFIVASTFSIPNLPDACWSLSFTILASCISPQIFG